MTSVPVLTSIDLLAASPMIALSLAALVLLVLGLFSDTKTVNRLSILSCFVTAFFCLRQLGVDTDAFSGMLFVDKFGAVLGCLVALATAASLYMGGGLLSAQGIKNRPDAIVLTLLASVGALSLISSAHLIILFVGFELLSVSVYVLSGLAREEKSSAEGALKYFILGAFSSAFMLFGISMIFGATGSLYIRDIALVASNSNPLLMLGLLLLFFGFAFKVSLVPFHVWTPDVYQGAPTGFTTYMASVVKVSAFAALTRILVVAFGAVSGVWVGLLCLVSIFSMTLGNLVALKQSSIKRMLAWSSVAHAGYAAIGLVAVANAEGVIGDGVASLIFYLIAYTLVTLLSFGVVLFVSAGTTAQYSRDSIDSFRGLGKVNPLLAGVMTLALLSLAGVPPLIGFFGKVFLFKAAFEAGFPLLVVIAAINSVVSLYYYLRVVVLMYFEEGGELAYSDQIETEYELPYGISATLAAAALGLVVLGLLSQPIFSLAQQAALELIS